MRHALVQVLGAAVFLQRLPLNIPSNIFCLSKELPIK